MSCLGPNYNPIPTREWDRFENVCIHNNNNSSYTNNNNNSIIWNGKSFPLSDLKKGNVLEYKKNSANITKQQRYAQIAKGKWINRTNTWASQTETYTNPNVGSLKRICYSKIITNNRQLENASRCLNSNQPTDLPLSCNKYMKPTFKSLPVNKLYNNNNNSNNNTPIRPKKLNLTLPSTIQNNTNTNINLTQKNVTPNVIPSGGMLVYNITENICTGEIYNITEPQTCFSSTDSDIPGKPTTLCYNSNLPTYYPRQRKTYSEGGKWPQGEKAFFYSNDPSNAPPINTYPVYDYNLDPPENVDPTPSPSYCVNYEQLKTELNKLSNNITSAITESTSLIEDDTHNYIDQQTTMIDESIIKAFSDNKPLKLLKSNFSDNIILKNPNNKEAIKYTSATSDLTVVAASKVKDYMESKFSDILTQINDVNSRVNTIDTVITTTGENIGQISNKLDTAITVINNIANNDSCNTDNSEIKTAIT
jgi:hypothetical protein